MSKWEQLLWSELNNVFLFIYVPYTMMHFAMIKKNNVRATKSIFSILYSYFFNSL